MLFWWALHGIIIIRIALGVTEYPKSNGVNLSPKSRKNRFSIAVTSRTTIYKYLNRTEPPPKMRARTRPNEKWICPFKSQIKELSDEGYTFQQIHKKIRDLGFQGNYSAVQVFLNQYRKIRKEGRTNETVTTITKAQITSYLWTGMLQLSEKNNPILNNAKSCIHFYPKWNKQF